MLSPSGQVDHARALRVAKDPSENTPRREAGEPIEITESIMGFHGHTLARFLTTVTPGFSLGCSLYMALWSITVPSTYVSFTEASVFRCKQLERH